MLRVSNLAEEQRLLFYGYVLCYGISRGQKSVVIGQSNNSGADWFIENLGISPDGPMFV